MVCGLRDRVITVRPLMMAGAAVVDAQQVSGLCLRNRVVTVRPLMMAGIAIVDAQQWSGVVASGTESCTVQQGP